jgi:hypothetical protein
MRSKLHNVLNIATTETIELATLTSSKIGWLECRVPPPYQRDIIRWQVRL